MPLICSERILTSNGLLKKNELTDINKEITKPLVLVSLGFSKDFIVFSFPSNHTIVGVALQKNQQNVEHPIAFFSKILRDEKLK